MAKSYIHELGDKLSNGFTADNLPKHIKEIAPIMYNDGSNNFNSIQSALNGKAESSHTHGNIANGGTLTDTAAAAAGNDYVVIRDADNAKIQTSTIKGTDVADAVSKKHSHSTLTLSTTAQAYDGTHTLALPSSDPYTSARTPSSHTHGNITNGGTITSDTTVASGDKIAIIDADNNKVARSGIAFDGSTTTTALTPKGTFETFSKLTIGATSTTAAAGNHTHTTTIASDSGSGTVVTLAHNTQYKLTAGGTSVLFKTPADSNTDTKVTQTADNSSSGADFEVLFSATGDNTTRTEGSRKSNKLTFQPSTGTLTATKFIGQLTGNVTGNCSGSSGSVNASVDNSITSTGTNSSMEILNGALSSASGGGGSCSIDGDGISFTHGVTGSSMTASSIATSGTGTFTGGASAKGRPIDGSATIVSNRPSVYWNPGTTHLVINRSAGSTTTIDLKDLTSGLVYWLHVPRDNTIALKNSSTISTFECYDAAFKTTKTTDTYDIRSHIRGGSHGGFSAAIVRSNNTFYVMMDY